MDRSPGGHVRRDPRRTPGHALGPYLSRVHSAWLAETPERAHQVVDGTLLFADISGFTRLTERLSRMGHVGAEEMSDALDATFGQLLAAADADGADLLKWGGDAVLLLFSGPDHALHAARAAWRMRERLRDVGRLETSAGKARLRMSQGLHSGRVHLFLVGDPGVHRELLVCGPEVTTVLELEAGASAGEIAVGPTTCALLDPRLLGASAAGGGLLLRRRPEVEDAVRLPRQAGPVDLTIGLPVAIREHLERGTGYAEHRSVAVAFVAWSGSDAMLAGHGPDETARALDEVVRNVAGATADHGVTFFETDVDRNGGKLMLVAGAPLSHGHEAERVLRAARTIVERAGALPLRVGVNVGHVFSGDFGPAFRRTYSVKGDAINLAARLVARAAPGQVLATQPVPAASRTGFTLTPLPPFTVKGKARPVVAVDVGPVEEAGQLPVVSATPFVGRGAELASLLAALDRVRARQGGILELVGQPGMGKSRLLAELASLAAAGGDVTVLTVSCDEYEAATPYHTVRQLLRGLLGLAPGTPAAAVHDRLRHRLAANAPGLLPWLPLLGTPLNVGLPDTAETGDLEDEHRKRMLEQVVGDVLHELLPTPTVVCVDDAQFLDDSSADLVRQLARRDPGEPWLLVLARSSGTGGPVVDDAPTIDLAPLPADAAVDLLQAASDAHPLPPAWLETLATRAGGNPLFLEALLADAARAPASGDPHGTMLEDLPPTVQELMSAQVDALAPTDRQVLRCASVLGMRVDLGQLATLLEGQGAAPDAATLRRLAGYLLTEDDSAVRFRHALLRDVAYEGLPYRLRRRLHLQVATELERRGPEDSPGSLSLHFLQAGAFEKAWRYAVIAARKARVEYANQEAAELFSRALTAQRRLPRDVVPDGDLGAVLEELGDTWFVIGLPERAAAAYARARRALQGDAVRMGRVVVKQARVDQRLRHLTQSLRRISGALRVLDGVPGEDAGAARSLLEMRYAISRMSQGRVDEALRWGDLAVREAEDSCDPAVLAEAWTNLHVMYLNASRVPPLPYGELALRAYRDLGDLPKEAHCINNLAVAAFYDHQWTEAAAQFEAAAARYRRIGDVEGEANALFNRADVLVRQGHLEPASALLDQALPIARAVSEDELVALVLREKGRLTARRGSTDDGLFLLAEARDRFAQLDEQDEVLATEAAMAEAELLAGDAAACLARCERLGASAPTAVDGLLPDLHRLRGRALLAAGDTTGAAAEFSAGVEAARVRDDRFAQGLNLVGLAATQQDGSRARTLADGRDILTRLGVVALPLDRALTLADPAQV
ncbi:MAG TPA: adenylate/guanylate cyclase domain-containing protein [Marmoricola sp.]|nr:adenylate/guanylate cyclase domain-containing protein [Marmoricola sp.]